MTIADVLNALATLEKERLNLDLDADKRHIVVLDLTEAGSKNQTRLKWQRPCCGFRAVGDAMRNDALKAAVGKGRN